MPRVTPRRSQAGLSSALAVLAEAAQRHANSPGRLQDVADRIAFRVHETEDLFRLCPSCGAEESAQGGGSIWQLICESDPLVAGLLVRRFFVERLGDQFALQNSVENAVLVALSDYPRNAGFFEVITHCPALAATCARRPGGLDHVVTNLHVLRDVVARAPPSRVAADRGCVGTTSAIYGVRDSDAYFCEAEILRAILEFLFLPGCRGWPAAAAQAGNEACAQLRQLCLCVADICCQLPPHRPVLARAFAFLGSAIPHAFAQNVKAANADFWILVQTLCSSGCGEFVEDVLSMCGQSRMHDAGDLQRIRAALFGAGRPEDDRRRGRKAHLGDVRLTLCHVVLLLFQVTDRLHHNAGLPQRFTNQVSSLFQARFLPPLRAALDSPLASRWPNLREAFDVLVSSVERLPVAESERTRSRTGLVSFRAFVISRFVPTDGVATAEWAEVELDPFGHPAALADAEDPEVQEGVAATSKGDVSALQSMPSIRTDEPVQGNQGAGTTPSPMCANVGTGQKAARARSTSKYLVKETPLKQGLWLPRSRLPQRRPWQQDPRRRPVVGSFALQLELSPGFHIL